MTPYIFGLHALAMLWDMAGVSLASYGASLGFVDGLAVYGLNLDYPVQGWGQLLVTPAAYVSMLSRIALWDYAFLNGWLPGEILSWVATACASFALIWDNRELAGNAVGRMLGALRGGL